MIKDRGLKKWNGFMLPEHKSMLNELANNQNYIEKPDLSEDQLDEINREISCALTNKQYVGLSVYHNGRIQNVFGIIKKFDSVKRQLIIEDTYFEKTWFVDLDNIVAAKCNWSVSGHDIIAD